MLKVIITIVVLFIGVGAFMNSTRFTSGQSNCGLQPSGDINCNGSIGLEDFEIWRKGYFAARGISPGPSVVISPMPTNPLSPAPSISAGISPSTAPSTAPIITPPPNANPRSETDVSFSSIPQAAQDAINAQYPGNQINQVKKRTFSNNAIDYEIELDDNNGDTWDVWVLPNGVITDAQLA